MKEVKKKIEAGDSPTPPTHSPHSRYSSHTTPEFALCLFRKCQPSSAIRWYLILQTRKRIS